MNKFELIEAIAEHTKTYKSDVTRLLDAFMTVTAKSLKRGEKVTLVGFGTFSVIKRAARNGRNPRTGKSMKIPARKAVKFKAGKDLNDMVR